MLINKVWKKFSFPIIKYFPAFQHWLRLPGLLSWIAVSFGIVCARFFPMYQLNFQPAIQFYIIKIILTTTSILAVLLFPSRKTRVSFFFLLALTLSTIRTAEQKSISQLLHQQSQNKSNQIIFGRVVSFPAAFKNGFRFLVRCDSASFDDQNNLHGKLIQCYSSVSPVTTSQVQVFGICTELSTTKKAYEYNESLNLLSKDIWAKMFVDSIKVDPNFSFTSAIAKTFRERVLTVLDQLRNPDHRHILQAAFLGESDYLSSSIKNSFRNSGIYHLLAISGLHAGMLIAATYAFLIFVPISTNFKHIIAIVVLWTYLFFIGFIPSLFRATIMTSFIISSLLFQKKNYSLQAIGFAGTLWLLYSPESLFLPGYQLSFAATIGIITLSPVLNRLCPKVSSPVADYFISSFTSIFNISFSGFLSTLPILVYHFGSISLFGLLANLVAVSIMSICMWAFFTSLLFESIISIIADSSIKISAVSLHLLNSISDFADQVPWSVLNIDSLYAETIILYVVFLIGLIAVEKKYTFTYLNWGLPVFLLLIPIVSIVKTSNNNIYIDHFNSKNCTALAVCWPHKSVWIWYKGQPAEFEKLYSRSILNWMRHIKGVSLDRVFFYHPVPHSKKLKLTEANTEEYGVSIRKSTHKEGKDLKHPEIQLSINPEHEELRFIIKINHSLIKCSLQETKVSINQRELVKEGKLLCTPIALKVYP